MLLGALPKTFQDGATKLLHNHLKNSSNTSVVRDLFLADSSSLISYCRCSVAWNTRNCCLEAVWQHRFLFAFIGTIETKNLIIFKCNIVITSANLKKKKRRSTWKLFGVCAFKLVVLLKILPVTTFWPRQRSWYHRSSGFATTIEISLITHVLSTKKL